MAIVVSHHEDALPIHHDSNPSRQHYSLPEYCCDHCGTDFKGDEDTIPGAHCNHDVVTFICVTGILGHLGFTETDQL
jgi:hypothetical protein